MLEVNRQTRKLSSNSRAFLGYPQTSQTRHWLSFEGQSTAIKHSEPFDKSVAIEWGCPSLEPSCAIKPTAARTGIPTIYPSVDFAIETPRAVLNSNDITGIERHWESATRGQKLQHREVSRRRCVLSDRSGLRSSYVRCSYDRTSQSLGRWIPPHLAHVWRQMHKDFGFCTSNAKQSRAPT